MAPHNLHITRQLAITGAIIGLGLVMFAIVGVAVGFRVDEGTAPIVMTVLGTLGVAVTGLVAALKATEAADTASRTHRIAELTASQNAAISQILNERTGVACPHPECLIHHQEGP